MGKAAVCLTVYFEDPFWVGVIERYEESRLTVCKVTFGSEPKDHDVYAYLLAHWYDLRFSPAVAAAADEKRLNPKRMQREVRKQVSASGIGTRSQQALKLQQEQNKQERKTRSRAEKQAEADRMFDLKQQKKREKHRGH
ncbi:MAG: YjdF family protein [Clostridia bacterium]|nr:YjdF family protein [Clostridia bacterium]